MAYFSDILTFDEQPTYLWRDGANVAKIVELNIRGAKSDIPVGDGLADTWIYSEMITDQYIGPANGTKTAIHPNKSNLGFAIEILSCVPFNQQQTLFYSTFRGHVTK